jgi:glycosyltransferase involved in cell wall biosynthesis
MKQAYPTISIITPSYNQCEFLEESIQSILAQNYPNLEYIIIDGGSTDGSVEIIKKYERYITYWVSENDHGMYHALNKGFLKSTGEIMAWLNTSDMYCPWALDVVADVFNQLPEVEWLTSGFPMVWDERSRAIKCKEVKGFSKQSFLDGRHLNVLPNFLWVVQQESTFWKRSLWERAGGLISADYKLAGDFELWARFFECADLHTINTTLGGFRKHENQKSSKRSLYWTEAAKAFKTHEISEYNVAGLDILDSSQEKKRKVRKQLLKVRQQLGKFLGSNQLDKYTFKNIVATRKEDPVKWTVKQRKLAFDRRGKEPLSG